MSLSEFVVPIDRVCGFDPDESDRFVGWGLHLGRTVSDGTRSQIARCFFVERIRHWNGT